MRAVNTGHKRRNVAGPGWASGRQSLGDPRANRATSTRAAEIIVVISPLCGVAQSCLAVTSAIVTSFFIQYITA